MIWLALGSGPSAPKYLEVARTKEQVDRTITTNWAIKLLPEPDYYFLTDTKACADLQAEARHVKASGGKLITLHRLPSALKTRCVDWFDEFLQEGPEWEPFCLSGLRCIEYAAKNGASRVLMVGMEGYGPTGDHYFDGRETRLSNYRLTKDVATPYISTFCRRYPTTMFVQYGNPNYTPPEADNWMRTG